MNKKQVVAKLVKIAKEMLKKANSPEEFLEAYVEAALWSSTDESDESGGEPLDANYSADDIAPEAQKQMKADCEKFIKESGELLEDADMSDAGHDFWLTRNRHGAGFWDGDWPEEAGKALTELSHKFGEQDMYVGDDGKIYVS